MKPGFVLTAIYIPYSRTEVLEDYVGITVYQWWISSKGIKLMVYLFLHKITLGIPYEYIRHIFSFLIISTLQCGCTG